MIADETEVGFRSLRDWGERRNSYLRTPKLRQNELYRSNWLVSGCLYDALPQWATEDAIYKRLGAFLKQAKTQC